MKDELRATAREAFGGIALVIDPEYAMDPTAGPLPDEVLDMIVELIEGLDVETLQRDYDAVTLGDVMRLVGQLEGLAVALGMTVGELLDAVSE